MSQLQHFRGSEVVTILRYAELLPFKNQIHSSEFLYSKNLQVRHHSVRNIFSLLCCEYLFAEK